jgi:mRNA interferase MazF
MARVPVVQRGDVWQVALDPVIGSEQAKTRPCLVVQRDAANETSPTIIIVPAVDGTKNTGNMLNVPVMPPEGGLRKSSLLACNQIRTVDRRRLRGQKLGAITPSTLALVDEGLRAILDLGD